MADNPHDQWVITALQADPSAYASAPGTVKLNSNVAAPTAEEAKQDKASAKYVMAALKQKQWVIAGQALCGMGDAAMLALVKSLPAPVVKALHEAAIKEPTLGKNSPVALATAALDTKLIGGPQAKRAAALAKKLSPADQEKWQALVDGSKPAPVLDYLEKGLAAGHTVAELEAFDKKIAGKDATWLQDNLSLTGNSKGKGVKQQWSMSCNATVVEAVRGQMDPLYALKMHEENPDLTEADDANARKMNPKLADDQKALLQTANPDGSLGGQARNRGDTSQVRGRWNTDLLNKASANTGLKYEREYVAGKRALDKGVKDINESIGKNMPVPIVIGDGTDTNLYAHYVLITATDPGPPRYYSIHDPASGDTLVRSEDQLRSGNLNVAGWSTISAIEKPTPVKVKAKP